MEEAHHLIITVLKLALLEHRYIIQTALWWKEFPARLNVRKTFRHAQPSYLAAYRPEF